MVTSWIAMGWNKEFSGGPGVYEIILGLVAIIGVSVLVKKI